MALTPSAMPTWTLAGSPAEETMEARAWDQAAQKPPVDPKHQKDIDRDIELGKEYTKEIAKDPQFKQSTNKEFIDRVNRIGGQMAAIANVTHAKALWGDSRMSTFEYHFTVLADKDVNAFSLPGGFIYVNEGLLNFIESDDELAGVLAHEIAHSAFRHVATLQRESSKLQIAQIPLILAAIFTSSKNAIPILEGSQLFQQAIGSGWSVKAEQAADYGGFQYMIKSQYNPAAMLTMMERLALDEKTSPAGLYDLGILRTHPPGKERAASLTKYLDQAGIAVHRSEVTTSYRTSVSPTKDGGFDLQFGKRSLIVLRGPNASGRATEAARRFNDFFDQVPQLYEVRSSNDGSVSGMGRTLIQVFPDDGDIKLSPAAKADALVKSTKNCLYMLAYRVWDAR